MNERKSVSTPVKTPANEVNAHTKVGRGSQFKNVKRGKKKKKVWRRQRKD